jgi:hypothetical protein
LEARLKLLEKRMIKITEVVIEYSEAGAEVAQDQEAQTETNIIK